VMTQYS